MRVKEPITPEGAAGCDKDEPGRLPPAAPGEMDENRLLQGEKKRAENELRRLNRALQTISLCNEILVRAEDEQEFLDSVCKTLVEQGGYRMAWVGYAEKNGAKRVRPVAHAGHEAGYLSRIEVTWADDVIGHGPIGTTIRTGLPVVNRSTETDAIVSPWKEEALKRGYLSSIGLPLRAGGEMLGALSIYASELEAFDSEEVNLLSRLADDLAFGVETIRLRAERQKAEAILCEQVQEIIELYEKAPWGYHSLGPDGTYLRINNTELQWLGCSRQEIVGEKRFGDLLTPQSSALFQQNSARFREVGEVRDLEYEMVRKDGSILPILLSTSAVKDAEGKFLWSRATAFDISERKRTEEALRLTQFSLDHASDAVFWMDPQGRIVYVNEAACRSVDRSREELLSLKIPDINPSFSPAIWNEAWEMVKAQGSRTFETHHQTKAGKVFPVEITTNYLEFGGIEYAFAFARDITERKRAEEALQESEARFRVTFENAGIGIALVDMQGHPVESNLALQTILGYSAEEFGRMTFLDYTHPEDRDSAWRLYQELLAGKRQKYEVEKRFIRKDGQVVWARLNVSLVRDLQGRPQYAVGMVEDITEHKRSGDLLARERELFEILMNNIPDKVYFKDGKSRFVRINRAHALSLGLKDASEAIGKTDFDFRPHERAKEAYNDEQKMIETGEPLIRKTEMASDAQGQVRWNLVTKVPFKDEQGSVAGIVGISCDITERKRAEEELLFKTMLLEAQAETTIDGILAVDQGTRVLFTNRRFAEIWNIPEELLRAQDNVRILQHGMTQLKDPDAFLSRVNYLYNHETEKSREELEFKDGRIVDRYSSPLRGPSGQCYGRIWYFRDVSEHKRLQQQFLQAQKMEAVGRLAGGVAHDFNNLLTVINGYSQLVLERLEPDTPVGPFVKEIRNAGERAASLTRQLLAFSRRQVLTLQALNLNSTISSLEDMLKRLIGEDILLRTVLAPDLGYIKADQGQIEQVVMNLAVNARDAMPSGGELTIESANAELDAAFISSHMGATSGPSVMLSLSDTGVGMTPQTKARLFEPFFTTKDLGKGTGLGLATVYGVVKQMGGGIWVYSEVGRGSVFKIYFPRAEDPPAATQKIEIPSGTNSGSETILLVEDDTGVRTFIGKALEGAGYKVLAAKDPGDAISICVKCDGPVHLLLTDVVMPTMSGPQVADRIRSLRGGIKVLFMSGHSDHSVLRQDVLGVHMAFLQKPFSAVALLKKIREVLAGR